MSGPAPIGGLAAEEQGALDRFIAAVRTHYGNRLHEIVLFGSRARGDYHEESDVDLAILLDDGEWDYWDEKTRIGDWAADALIDHGLYIQPWPIALSNWKHPDHFANASFVHAVRRDAKQVLQAS